MISPEQTARDLYAERDRLRQRVAELEALMSDYEEGAKSKEWASIVKDAERYREWKRRQLRTEVTGEVFAFFEKSLDKSIDAAMAEGEPL